EAGAAAEIEDAAYALLINTPELIEERGKAVVAGINEDRGVDPCQPRVRLNLLHRSQTRCGSDSEDLGLGGRELLVREHALGMELRQVLELRGRVVSRGGRLGLLLLLLLLLLVLLLVLLVVPGGLTALHP